MMKTEEITVPPFVIIATPSLINYGEGYILVTGNITADNLANNSAIAIKDGSNSLIDTAPVLFKQQ